MPWIQEHCSLGDPVRDECYRAGLSALVHRLLKFGFEETVNRLSARDCLSCCLMCGGIMAEFFLRTAFTRALVEDDQPVVQRILQTPFIPESRLWLGNLMRALSGDAAALEAGALWLEQMDGEERAVATLVIGRIYPHFALSDWLLACPIDYPRLPAEISLLLLKDPKYLGLVRDYLRRNPAVRYALDDSAWSAL